MTETPPGDSEQASLDRAVVIALGSNLAGDYASSRELLDAALAALNENGLKVARASSWWGSKAWPEGSGPDFLNGVALVETSRSPLETLESLQTIERAFGRDRSTPNAARTLDLDLVAHGRLEVLSAELTVPHPRSSERFFVMGPLAEIAPCWMHPIRKETAAKLASTAEIGADASSQRALQNRPNSPKFGGQIPLHL